MRNFSLRAPFRLIRKSQLRHTDPPSFSLHARGRDSRSFDAHLTQGRPPCNARVTDELRMQRTALPHFLCRPTLCPTPICHGTTSCSCTPQGDSSARSFQQHFTTFTLMVAAGHGAEYPSGATGWQLEKADIVYVILQGSSQSLCSLFPRMSASRMRVPNPVGSAQPATSVAGPSFAGRSGHDGGTLAATSRRTAALRHAALPPTRD